MAGKFDALEKLRDKFLSEHHDYRASTDMFPSLNVDKIAKEMELAELGEKRGSEEQPPKTAKAFDDVESSIIEYVQEAKRTSHQKLEDRLHLYARRVAGLNLDEQLGMLQQANTSSLSDFNAEISNGLDELHAKRTDLKAATDELNAFKKEHRLERVARVNSGLTISLKWGILVLVFLVESILNGFFLSKGNEQGILGGVTEALAFSFVNIGAALLLAYYGARGITHRSFLRKLIAAGAILVYVAGAIIINLLLAHYREVSGTFMSGAGLEAIKNMRADPFGLNDISSWMLFLVGLLFSVIAFIDGCLLSDPYFGYAGVEKRRLARRDDYIATKAEQIEYLQEVRDEHNEQVEDILKELSARKREYAAILTSRNRIAALFDEHQAQLEEACRQLLAKYREANVQARSTAAPRHFSQVYKLPKTTNIIRTDGEISQKELDASIVKARKMLSEQMVEIGRMCDGGIKQYRDLDILFPEASNEQA
ncbi:hypothetical protein [Nitratireductor sp. GZWM139]|uniref:hypothetical protein n=1 Tax=Nitratireductor sp. GZWM139 TaxID=2950541 RepID=UPI0024BE1452|nr:hypothetical protein [Nitratireductor sp. GZWM139]MDJ1465969.1 hypothetical protein [Nitratireductor sp. GZWM139]